MRQRPTLPGRLQPSTIGVLRLNFCVRNGNRWNPQAITTANGEQDCGGRSVSVLLFQALFSAESSPAFSGSSLSSGFAFALPSFGLAFARPRTLLLLAPLPFVRFASPSFLFPGFPVLRFLPLSRLSAVFSPSCTLATVYEIRDHSLVISIGLCQNRLNQAIDLLVSSSCMHYCTSTDDLSTW